MKQCKLIISSETNAKFVGLDPVTRKKLVKATEFLIHAAKYTVSYQLGRWDGKVSYTTIGGGAYVNLLDKLVPIVIENGYEIELEDNRKQHEFIFSEIDENYFVDNFDNHVWPAKHKHEGELILLREQQVDLINTFLNNTQCLVEAATGLGKTMITATLSHAVEPYGRSIIIVPNKSLVNQTEEDYKNIGLDVGVFYGDRKEYNKKHTICTWQSLSILDKKTKWPENFNTTPEMFLHDFIEDVVAVIVDEAHGVTGDSLKNLLTGPFENIPIRWGMTGTVPKDDSDYYALLVSIGPLLKKMDAHQLQQDGILSSCHVNMVQLLDTVSYKSYQDEYKYLTENKDRLDWISTFIEEISLTGNTLVLCDRVATGDYLIEKNPNAVFVRGSTKQKSRKEQYDEIQDNDNKILIATFGVASTGINVPRIFNLILIEPGKSFVRVIQSIGRGLRQAKDKDHVNVFDLSSSCKFSKRHMYKRKTLYDDAKYPNELIKIDWQTKKNN